ncbi:single-stranded-DNA-specific exonuclease RecJ [Caldichromatium japonicum]|uniref:Single-stranded-DNA-specific exonuclease RecJ n=1 Tax=Caldichromatium japonicum TaxID=2699430 RepID=A0A6G7VHA1_9GAMM|nr:single-stranded-DNA-specific exonuclease RecJ [Caldichromatium japonicum]
MTTIRIRRLSAAPILARTPDELIVRLYAHRGIYDPATATLDLEALIPPDALHGLESAVEHLVEQIRRGGHLLVVGDYDADGATGSALAVRGLRALGAERVSFLVPSRFTNGYGLSPQIIDVALDQRADLLLTVDNGTSSHAAIAYANDLGLPVVVTDHHLVSGCLPEAAAIVNPNQPSCAFPSKHLAGVGVVFYLLAALRRRLRALGWFGAGRPEPNLADLLDLVAVGTIADVVMLDRNNRILVEHGLRRIRAGRCRPGILALFELSGRDHTRTTAADLAFYIAPRLNAAGRLSDMSLGLECLLTDDPDKARALAQRLDALNRERKALEAEMRAQAEVLVKALRFDDETLPPALCLFGEDWHQGIAGIIAGRIRDRYHRPTIAFASGGDGRLRGSGRSIEALHLRDALAWVDQRSPGLIERFGGHAMAAGLTLHMDQLDTFRLAFAEAVRLQFGDTPPMPELLSDGVLPPELLTLETAEALRLAGPWGKGFPEPCFDGAFEVLDRGIMGESHLRLRVMLPNGQPVEAVGFRLGEHLERAQGRVHLVYRLEANRYQETTRLRLLIDHLAVEGVH